MEDRALADMDHHGGIVRRCDFVECHREEAKSAGTARQRRPSTFETH
jgi:hypothetical protein